MLAIKFGGHFLQNECEENTPDKKKGPLARAFHRTG
jgi:hypothetical protein